MSAGEVRRYFSMASLLPPDGGLVFTVNQKVTADHKYLKRVLVTFTFLTVAPG